MENQANLLNWYSVKWVVSSNLTSSANGRKTVRRCGVLNV